MNALLPLPDQPRSNQPSQILSSRALWSPTPSTMSSPVLVFPTERAVEPISQYLQRAMTWNRQAVSASEHDSQARPFGTIVPLAVNSEYPSWESLRKRVLTEQQLKNQSVARLLAEWEHADDESDAGLWREFEEELVAFRHAV